jgi:hypothetical protein
MTDLNTEILGNEVLSNEVREQPIDELDSVSGGDLLNQYMIPNALLFCCPWIPLATTLR